MPKTLILLRHAHRSKKLGADADNGLSDKGEKQAQRLLKFFEVRFPDEKPGIVTSPKKRCVETIQPIAKKKKVQPVVSPLLDEGGSVHEKAKAFFKWWKDTAPELTVACSHGDWLPVFIKLAAGANTDMKKGAWAELLWEYETVQFTWLVQSFDDQDAE